MNLTNHVAPPFEVNNIQYKPHLRLILSSSLTSDDVTLEVAYKRDLKYFEHRTYDIENIFTDSHCNLQRADGNRFD